MTEPRMCCNCAPPMIDCTTADLCVRVTFAGLTLQLECDYVFVSSPPPGCPSLYGHDELNSVLAGVNRRFRVPLSTTPLRFAASVPLFFRYEVPACDPAPSDEVVYSGGSIVVQLVCVENELKVQSVSFGVSSGSFCDQRIFSWSFLDNGGVYADLGVPLANKNDCGDCSVGRGTISHSGTVIVEVLVDGVCEQEERFAIAEACDEPGQLLVVDLATNVGDKPGLIYQGENYFLTPDTSPDTPVGVTWTDELCPEPVMSDWYLATRCPPPGRLNGVWPDPIRYYSPSGPNLDDAIYLNFEDSPRPNCQTSIRYQPTNTPTDEALPIGVRIDGITPCSGTDIRICDDDTGEPPQNVCDICANVGPASPAWLIAYCENANCLESGGGGGGGGESMMMAAPASRPTQRRTTRSNGRLWTRRQMVASYAKARRSGRHATPQTIALRQLSCFGDEAGGIEPCPRLIQRPDGKGSMGSWCGACGCGVRKAARLDEDHRGLSKLQFTNLDCPLGRPGFSNHDPGEAPDSGIREG